MRYRFIFILSFIYPLTAFAQYPYDTQCSKSDLQRTERLTQDFSLTTAGFCETCDNRSKNEQDNYLSNLEEVSIIPKQCFLAMALRGNSLFSKRQYVHCKSKEQSSFDRNRKFCINEDYINTIHTAWKEMTKCFNYSMERQEEIFHLVNQESGGVLNVKSNTGARCLGQLTIDYVKTINKTIHSIYKKNPLRHSEIYREVIQRCPQLKEKILKDINHITCKTSMDPHTCLFYTFYGLERNHRKMKKNLQSKSDYMGTKEFSQELKDKYQLPIKLNEMLVIRGTAKSGKSIHWVIWDDSELYSLREKIDDSKKLLIKKVPLFKNQEDIEQMFNYWAHNGGQSLVNSSLIKRIEKLKKNISMSCPPDLKQRRCLAREQVKAGEGIKSSLALKMFTVDLRATYPSKSARRRKELSEYVNRIQASNRKVFNYTEGSADTNNMLNLYKSASGFSEEELNSFQRLAFFNCPRLSFD